MSRYIDADKLILKMNCWYEEMRLKYGETDQFNMGYAEGINAIENAPTADVIEVVRCKDCKHRYVPCRCALWFGSADGKEYFVGKGDDFYCSYGERSKNGT